MNPPLAKPNLKPRRGLMWATIGVFAVWVGILIWIWVSQVVLKSGK